ncbi:MAG TPA: ABC-three component system protein [Bryobacteraceae bacterium]
MSKKKQSPHVPGQYYGYSLQCTRLVHLLLGATPGATVSLEVLEDVAHHGKDGDVLVQTKSGLESNPVADRSVELWKTIRNWIDGCNSGDIDPSKTSFQIYVAKPRRGGLCVRFSESKTDADAVAAIDVALASFYGKSTRSKKADSIPQPLREQLDVVFSEANRDVLKQIVQRFTLSSGSGHAYEDLVAEMKKALIDEDVAEDVLLRGLGWVKATVDVCIEKGLPAVLSVDEFRRELTSFRNKLKSRPYLPSFAGAPPTEQDITANRLCMYVQQLQLVDSPEEEIFKAISDFLSAKANIVQYAERGYVNRESLLEFESALKTLWDNLRKLLELDTNLSDERLRGRKLALQCLAERRRLEGIEVPDDFTPGCFHMLADKPDIGWHPRYAALLRGER